MGLILDSSVVIAAERRGDRVEQLIEKIVKATGDQEAALSAIGVTELIHGIYRAQTQEIRLRRESFLNELLADLTVFPYTKETALLAGKNGRRTAEPRRGDSVRRFADRSHRAVARLQGADRQSPRLPSHPRSYGHAVLVPASEFRKSLLCARAADYNQR